MIDRSGVKQALDDGWFHSSKNDSLQMGVIAEVVLEPLGGAHRGPQKIVENLEEAIRKNLIEPEHIPVEQLLNLREREIPDPNPWTDSRNLSSG